MRLVSIVLFHLSWAAPGALAVKGRASLRSQRQLKEAWPGVLVGTAPVAKKACKKAKKQKGAPKKHPMSADDGLPYCLHGARTAEECDCLHGARTAKECEAARRGVVPASIPSLPGILKMQVSSKGKDSSHKDFLAYDEPPDAAVALTEILRTETALLYVGCPLPVARFLQPPSPDSGEPGMTAARPPPIKVTGIAFGSMAVLEDCEMPPPPPPDGTMDNPPTKELDGPGETGGPGMMGRAGDDTMKCSTMQTGVEIFYEGKSDNEVATKPEEDEMLALLTEIVRAQAVAGDFEKAGISRLEVVESRSGVFSSDEENQEHSGGINTSSTRFKVGVALGALFFLVFLLLATYCCCCRRRRKSSSPTVAVASDQGKKPDETDDSSNEGENKTNSGIWPFSRTANKNKFIDEPKTGSNKAADEGDKPKTGIWPLSRSRSKSADEGDKPRTGIWPFSQTQSKKSADEGGDTPKTGIWPFSRSRSNKSNAANEDNTPIVNATVVNNSFEDNENQSPGTFCSACVIQ